MENRLEEIFWKDGKFVNEFGKKVSPEPIGEAKMISTPLLEDSELSKNRVINELNELMRKDKIYELANAYCKGDWATYHASEKDHSISTRYHTINFHKISKDTLSF